MGLQGGAIRVQGARAADSTRVRTVCAGTRGAGQVVAGGWVTTRPTHVPPTCALCVCVASCAWLHTVCGPPHGQGSRGRERAKLRPFKVTRLTYICL